MKNTGHWNYKQKWFHVCFQSQFPSARGQCHPLTTLALYATPADPNSPDEGPVYYDGVRTSCNLFIKPLTK